MLSFSSLLLSFGLASAAVVAPRQTCTPTFGDRTVSIVDLSANLEWQPQSLTNGVALKNGVPATGGEWTFPSTGDSDGSVYIQSAADSTLSVVEHVRTNFLSMTSGSPTPDKFAFTCTTCDTSDPATFHGVYASGCSIVQLRFGVCSARTMGGVDTGIYLWGCDTEQGQTNSTWAFVLE